jgi:hypothetical protein
VGVVAFQGFLKTSKENVSVSNCGSITDWVRYEFFKCSSTQQNHVTYLTNNGNEQVSCQLTGKKHSKFWKDHFELSGYANSINAGATFLTETTDHIPNNGAINFHCAVGSNTDNQCSFYCNSGALDANGNTVDPSKLRSFLIEK